MSSRDEIEAKVDRVLVSILRIDADLASAATRMSRPEWTSLAQVEIFFALEEELGIRFPEDSIAFAESRDDLVEASMHLLQIT